MTVASWALVAAGVALRLQAFLENSSLSIDEAALARNLLDRPWPGLLRPLDYAQAAPPGFLLVEKAVVSAFGTSEFALRAFPLICGIASVWLCWTVSRRSLPPVPAVCALGLAAVNNVCVGFSARVKPYSADVAAALLIVLLGIQLLERPPRGRQAFWLGLAGLLTVTFSFTAVFVLAGAAVVCACFACLSRGVAERRALLITPALWSVGAVCGAVMGRATLTASDAAYMNWFWGAGFIPVPPTVHDLVWIAHQLGNLFGQTGRYRASLLWIVLAALGTWSLRRRGRADVAWLLAAPLLVVIAASAAQLYPFAPGRLQLFLLPLLLILATEGASFSGSLFSRLGRLASAVPTILILALGVSAGFRGPDRDGDDVRAVVQHVRRNWRPGDRAYVYYGAGQTFLYYAPRLGFVADDVVLGTCSRGSARTYLRELDGLRGHPRVWILMSLSMTETSIFLTYLDAIGVRVPSMDVRSPDTGGERAGARGYLYDLSPSARSAQVSAGTFPLSEAFGHDQPFPWSCYGVFSPTIDRR